MIEETILSKLASVESETGFRILFACESGSRAWGFASADSDFDVRFVFAWPAERYLAVSPYAETFETALDENDIDLSGWELRKSLNLFRKSNGALCEWLRSPIIYREDAEVMADWRALLDSDFVPRSNAIHYLGLCRQMWSRIDGSGTTTAKRYLYALRALFAARHVLETEQPAPVDFHELASLVDAPVVIRAAVADMIQEKATGREGDFIPRNLSIDEYLVSELGRLGDLADKMPEKSAEMDRIDAFFRATISRG